MIDGNDTMLTVLPIKINYSKRLLLLRIALPLLSVTTVVCELCKCSCFFSQRSFGTYLYTHTYWVDMKTFLFRSPVKYMHTSLNKVLSRANRQHLYKNRNFFRCKGYTHTHTTCTRLATDNSGDYHISCHSFPFGSYSRICERKKLHPVQMQQTIRQK